MAIADVFPLPTTPDCLNAYYTRAARVVEMFEGAKKLPKRIWQRKYEGNVSSYNITGQGVQKRFLYLEQRRENARFCQDWQQWHNGCEPQDFTSQTVKRPGLTEKWAHLLRLQKITCFYNLETIAANTFLLPKRIAADMDHLQGVRNDLYSEYFHITHLAHSDRRFAAWKTSATTAWFGDKQPSSTVAPWRWGTDADGCRFCGEKIFLAPGIDADELLHLQTQSLQILQAELAGYTSNYDLNKLSIITDAFTQQFVVKKDSSLVNALLYKTFMGQSGALNPSLAANHNVLDFFSWETDPLPWRGYYDPTQESDAGEQCIVRIDPFLDVAVEEGVESDLNPDYVNPNVAAFQLDIPWMGNTYSPMRAVIPNQVGKIKNHDQVWAAWEWINNKDMTDNPYGDKGFFSLRDNMMAAPEALARKAAVILSRRPPLEMNIIDLPDLESPTHESEASTTDCESVQWKQNDPNCVFNAAEGYGYDFADGGCANCQ